jgi:uncharacterized membrane protein YkvA (DUF1232 family)
MKRILLLLKVVRRDLSTLLIAVRQPDRPAWLMPAMGMIALYAIAPFNVAIPVVGLIDDGLIVPVALHLLVRCLPARSRSMHAPK